MKKFFWSEREIKSYGPLKLPMFGCLFLIGQEIWQKFSYNSLIANPSAFQNGMTLENRVKIERVMSKNISLKLQMP